MDGTPKTPERYTVRFGLPRFGAVGKIMVLRLSCESAGSFDDARCSAAEGLSTYRLLTSGSYTPVIGAAEERSAMTPTWLRLASGRACALLEDTRKAKRLFSLAGQELQSAHLSCFAFDDVDAGAKLLKTATAAAAALGSPALFCAVPSERAGALLGALGELRGVLAPATVYAAGLEPGSPWHLNTAEI